MINGFGNERSVILSKIRGLSGYLSLSQRKIALAARHSALVGARNRDSQLAALFCANNCALKIAVTPKRITPTIKTAWRSGRGGETEEGERMREKGDRNIR